jgi:hypothetical protein
MSESGLMVRRDASVPEAPTEKLKPFILDTEEMKLLVTCKDGFPTLLVSEATGSGMETHLYAYLAMI